MIRGRKPDTDDVQNAKGRPGKRRRATPPFVASTVGATAVQPSSKLSRPALHIWRTLAPDLEQMNFLRATDSAAFSRYCQTLAKYWEISHELDREGVVYLTESAHGSMKRVNPLFLVQERLSRRLTEFEDRFGLTPAARQQILIRLAAQQPSLPLSTTPKPEASAAQPSAPESGPIGLLNSPGSQIH
jgi:P27 family predicted phage terminase small subunit